MTDYGYLKGSQNLLSIIVSTIAYTFSLGFFPYQLFPKYPPQVYAKTKPRPLFLLRHLWGYGKIQAVENYSFKKKDQRCGPPCKY